MRSLLIGGPYDGYVGEPDLDYAPFHIGIVPCPGCGCGRMLHLSLRYGGESYTLIGETAEGTAVYEFRLWGPMGRVMSKELAA